MFITESDRNRLANLLKRHNAQESPGHARLELLTRLQEAAIVSTSAIPGNVITMNSIVRLIEIPSGGNVTYTLVYPPDANVDRLRISVLAPLGVALLGRSEGEIVEFAVPSGTKRYFIEKVVYQPEAQLHNNKASC